MQFFNTIILFLEKTNNFNDSIQTVTFKEHSSQLNSIDFNSNSEYTMKKDSSNFGNNFRVTKSKFY